MNIDRSALGVGLGNAGDLGHVREKLIQTLAFLSNRKPETIENLLGECR